jgi:PAS domain S-box-containing protein
MIDATGRDPLPAAAASEQAGEAKPSLPAYSVLQQQIIDARDQLDREVARLTRMQAFNARVLRLESDTEFVPAIGEAIVDIFELEFGICWLLDDSGVVREPIGVLGLPMDTVSLRAAGARLASSLAVKLGTQATVLGPEALPEAAPGMPVGQAILAACLDGAGRPLALLLGGNTVFGANFFDTATPELVEAFGLFAQQMGALIENREGRITIEQQMADFQRANQRLGMAVEVTQVVFWELDFVTGRLQFDQAMLPRLGLEANNPVENLPSWVARIHPDDRIPFAEHVERAVRTEDSIFDLEYRMSQEAGEYQWIHTKGRVVERGPGGQPLLAVGTSMNITARKRAEESIRSSEIRSRNLAAMLRLMCDNVPDMIWAKDLENRYLFANKAMCEQLLNATDTDEPVGKTDAYFALRERASRPDDPRWHTFGELRQGTDTVTLNHDKPSVFEEYGNIKGKSIYLDVHQAPFRVETGEVIGTVGSARDVTERKAFEAELAQHRHHLEELVARRTAELLETEARASHILHCSADGLYGVDSEGIISFVNPAACQMLGYRAEQMIGQSAHRLVHHSRPDGTPYPPEVCPGHRALRLGEEVRVDCEVYWHMDGHAIPVMYAIHPTVQDGKVVGGVISFVDMSEQRAAAQAREQALLAAENLARARSEFLANMSHEIRTPLNGVLGFAQIGYRNCEDSEKARNAFEKILTSGKLLLGIIGEILDFSKIEAGKFGIEHMEVSLVEVIKHAVELIGERARAKRLGIRVQLAPDLPKTCMSDPLRVGQVLINLLSNAVKFTEVGSVGVSASRQGDQLVFRVTDTGIGIGGDQLARLFNPFQQADGSTSRRFGGTGLGLAISKRILELMGGQIFVESQPGIGSTFEFRIPYVRPVERDSEPTPAAGFFTAKGDKPLAGIAILVAEDDLINQMVLEETLVGDGARVVMVGTGQAAVERVIRDGPAAYDIVLMDMQMPEMDGLEATRRILKLAPDLPIIGQTAHAFSEEREKCFAAGMVAHIAKPIDPDELVQLVQVHVSASTGTERGEGRHR